MELLFLPDRASGSGGSGFIFLPHPLRSVQVDGGSEFRAEFEDACRTLNLPLYILPPSCPKNRGHLTFAGAD